MLTVIGWGDTIPVPPFVDPDHLFYPQQMMEVQVPVVSDATCRRRVLGGATSRWS